MYETVRRIYHEDQLMAQRTTYFLSSHAFLLIGFVTLQLVLTPGFTTWIVELAIVFLGILLACLTMSLGWRTIVALSFWRECYERNVPFSDTLIRDFFRDGEVEIKGNGWILLENAPEFNQEEKEKIPPTGPGSTAPTHPPGAPQADSVWTPPPGTMDQSAPWKSGIIRSTNFSTSVFLSGLLATFWVTLSLAIPLFPVCHLSLIAILPGVVALVLFYYAWTRRPRRAKWRKTHLSTKPKSPAEQTP